MKIQIFFLLAFPSCSFSCFNNFLIFRNEIRLWRRIHRAVNKSGQKDAVARCNENIIRQKEKFALFPIFCCRKIVQSSEETETFCDHEIGIN